VTPKDDYAKAPVAVLLWEVEAGTTGYIAGFAKHFEARVQRSEDFALAATDPATIGCLQALARQAWKSPKASAFYSPITGAWMFMPKRNKSIKGASEADVLLAAIIAGSESIQPTTGKGFNICDDESYLRDEGVVLGSEARKRWDE